MMETTSDSRRLLVCCLLFSVGIGLLMVLLNLPAKMVRVGSVEYGSPVGPIEPFSQGSTTHIKKTGWPVTQQVDFTSIDDNAQPSVQTLFFSYGALVINATLILIVMAATAVFTVMRHRQTVGSANPVRIKRFYDFGLASLCLAVPMLFYGLSWVQAKHHLEVANKLRSVGQCQLSAEVPEWLAKRVPKIFAPGLYRMTDIEIAAPSPEIFDALESIGTLRSVRIHKTRISGEDLDFLKRSNGLSSLSLVYCRLAPEAITQVSDLKHLRRLSLVGCPLETADLRSLDKLQNLESVNLLRTGIRLSEFQQPGWSKSVQRLRLPRPKQNESDQLMLTNWPNLSELAIQSWEQLPNDAVLSIDLSNCPRLDQLQLDRWQLHSLNANNLPRLKSILEPVEFLVNAPFAQILPAMTRWHQLKLKDVPVLNLIECQANDLESIELIDVPSLQTVSLGSAYFDSYENDLVRHAKSPSVGKIFVNAIKDVPNINHVQIKNVRLDKGDVDQLCKMPFLQHLQCTNTRLLDGDLDSLVDAKELRRLDLGSCRLSEDRLVSLLSLPNLKSISANLSKIQNLRLNEHVRIEELQTRPMMGLRSIELEHLPRFGGGIAIQGKVERLQMQSVPLLRELIVECPWPADYAIKDLEGLQRFAGGGPQIRDDIIDVLCACGELDQLTLAYPGVTHAKLKEIRSIKTLTSLELPGCPIDDDVVSHWSPLTRLRRVCFDDTSIGPEAIRWLSGQESLRSVSLNHLKLDGPSQQALASLGQINDISLVQTELEDDAFVRFLHDRTIQVIDLSKTSLSEAKLNAIATSESLRFCALNDCNLTLESVRKLLDENPALQIEINRNEALARSKWSPSHHRRIHLASEESRWACRLGQQHRSTIRSRIPPLGAPGSFSGQAAGESRFKRSEFFDHAEENHDHDESEANLVSRPFSLALFRKSSDI